MILLQGPEYYAIPDDGKTAVGFHGGSRRPVVGGVALPVPDHLALTGSTS